jgi:hypothetical protein
VARLLVKCFKEKKENDIFCKLAHDIHKEDYLQGLLRRSYEIANLFPYINIELKSNSMFLNLTKANKVAIYTKNHY